MSLAQTVSGTNCLWHKLDSNTKISRQSRTPLNAFSLLRILICKYSPRKQFIYCSCQYSNVYVHTRVGQPVCTQTCWPACMYTNLLASLYVHKLVGQPVCTQTCYPACMYTNLLASLYVHKLVGQPVCTQTCWSACMYTQQSTWVQVICSQVCHSSDTSNPCYLLRFDANKDYGSVTQMNILS